MSKAERWERKAVEQVADCQVFRVVREEHVRVNDGRRSDFYVIESPNWVNIVGATKNGEIIMIEQFRQGIGEITLELPGGLLDGDDRRSTPRRANCARKPATRLRIGWRSENLDPTPRSRAIPFSIFSLRTARGRTSLRLIRTRTSKRN